MDNIVFKKPNKKKGRIIGIHQPNFLPWLGYFYKIIKADNFVFLNNVQFQKIVTRIE